MTRHITPARLLLAAAFLLTPAITAQAPATANKAFDSYIHSVESRLAQQHQSPAAFLVPVSTDKLHNGEIVIDHISSANPSGAMLHHWRGTAFVPGATVADFERLTKKLSTYPKVFAPQVTSARVLAQQGDHLQATMRVQQKHVITVVMDTDYDIYYGHLDPHRGFSISRSTRIAEIDAPNTPHEHALSPADEHGFLWRLNTYWTYEERDGGLYLQIESVTLTRNIPTGLGWIVRPFVESVPRESLEFTLRSTAKALHK